MNSVGVGPANAVVVGLAASHFNYERLNEAFRALQSGAQLIAIHKARFLKRTDGLAMGPGTYQAKGIGIFIFCKKNKMGSMILIKAKCVFYACLIAGGFVSALEYASGAEAQVVGKPEKSFFEAALQEVNRDLLELEEPILAQGT